MPLLKTIVELQKVASVDINFDEETLAPYITYVEQQYLKDVLGAAYIADLQTAYDASTLDVNGTALLPYIHRVIGPLAVYHMIPNLSVRVTNNGLQVTSSTDFAPASGAEIYYMRKEVRDMGMNALDSLFAFLEANKANYTTWASDPVYTQFKQYFISSAAAFQKYVNISSSRVIYGKLLPIMANMELRYISATLTEALFNDLKGKFVSDTLSTKEQYLITGVPGQFGGGYLCRAIALFTYQMALKDRNLVDDIAVITDTRAENYKKNKEEFGDYAIITDDYGALAEGALSDAVQYLNENASDSVFPLWFNSKLYINPSAPSPTSSYNNGAAKGSFMAL